MKKTFYFLMFLGLLSCKDDPKPITPKSPLEEVWKQEMQPNNTKGVISQPAITYKNMFIHTTKLGDFNQHIYARDFDTGKVIWEFTPDREDSNGTDAFKLFGEVIVLSTDKDVYGIDVNTGKELWKVEVKNKIMIRIAYFLRYLEA